MIFVFLLWMFSFCEVHALDDEASRPIKPMASIQPYEDLSQIPADKINAYQTFLSRLSVHQNPRERSSEGKMSCLYFREKPLAEKDDGALKTVALQKIEHLKSALTFGKSFYKQKSDQYIKDSILKPLSRLIMAHREIENCVQKICFPCLYETRISHPGYETSTAKEDLHKEFWSFQPIYQAFAQRVIDILTWRGQVSPNQTCGVFYEDKGHSTGMRYRYLFFRENNMLDVLHVDPYLPVFSCSFLPNSSIKDTKQIREMYFQYGQRVEDKALIIGRDESAIFCEPYLGQFPKTLEDGRMLPPFSRQDKTHRKALTTLRGGAACDILCANDPMLPLLKKALDESAEVYHNRLITFGRKIELDDVGSTIVLPVAPAPQNETLYTLLFLEYLMEEAKNPEVELQNMGAHGETQGNTQQPGTKMKRKGSRKKASKDAIGAERAPEASSSTPDAKEISTKGEGGAKPSVPFTKEAWLEARAIQQRIEEASQLEMAALHQSLEKELKEQIKKEDAQRIAKEQKERQEEVVNQTKGALTQKSSKKTQKGQASQRASQKKTALSHKKEDQRHQEAIIDGILKEKKESGRIKYRVAHKILGKMIVKETQGTSVTTQTKGSHATIHVEGGQSVTVPKKHSQKDTMIPTTRLKQWMRGVLSSVGSSLGKGKSESTDSANTIDG